MKPKRDHSYQQDHRNMSPYEAKSLATFLVWGALVAIVVLTNSHFAIFLVAAIAAMCTTLFIWAGEALFDYEHAPNRDAQAALYLLELLEDDELEQLKSRLRVQIQTHNTVVSQQENTVIGQQILIR